MSSLHAEGHGLQFPSAPVHKNHARRIRIPEFIVSQSYNVEDYLQVFGKPPTGIPSHKRIVGNVN